MIDPDTTVQVHLEEWGQHSWVKALVNTLGGTFGSAQYRFVARPEGTPDRPDEHVATGATFPVMRFQDLDDQHLPNAWIEAARERLDELDEVLRRDGWQRSTDAGDHWWSRTYVAAAPTPHDPEPGQPRRTHP